ncbi:hypothetical protein LOK49_LG12G01522 [Camellia lanceoleosa]|uniref:Uncharacterized protein n=1 Tax=Camellia lanceoleosa TaxID=1840588 RepID=A0ACC0FVX3_9ERIC|nr:hypothetical protein LOK49_LG12G01522 [Camellia lanceoleosa]
MTQNVISIQAKSSDTVNEFIAKIPQGVLASIVGEPALFLEETRLMGDKALAYYDLHSGSFLTLERVIQIHVVISCKQIVKVQLKVPVIVRLEGTNVDQGKRILKECGMTLITAEDLDYAAEKAVRAIKCTV